MSLTLTTVDNFSTPKTMELLLQPPHYQSALNRLTIILDKYISWDDSLSKRLFKWGVTVISIDLAREVAFGNEIHENAKNLLCKLVNKILIDPLKCCPLDEPVLERNYIFDAKTFIYLKNHGNRSPYDGMIMSEPRPHLFAQEMIEWVKSLPLPSTLNDNKVVSDLTLLNKNANFNSQITQNNIDAFQLILYCERAKNVMLKQALKAQRLEVAKATEVVAKQIFQQARELIRNEVSLAEARAASHEQAMERRLSQIEGDCQTIVDVMQIQVNDVKTQLHAANEKANNLETKNILNENEITRLRIRIAQEVERVNKIEKKSKKSCIIQ